jgi:hypothetical protein
MGLSLLLLLRLIGGAAPLPALAPAGVASPPVRPARAPAAPAPARQGARKPAAGGALILAQAGSSPYTIVTSAHAPPAVRRGGLELQSYLERITGARLPLRTDAAPLPSRAILVGPSIHLERLKAVPDPKGLGPEGFAIRTLGPHLVIAGGGPRGTMYGCTAFLERLGVRWYTPTVTKVPRLARVVVSRLDVRETPAFEYREPFFSEAQERDWAARLRLNGHAVGASKAKSGAAPTVDESTGGQVSYYPFVHTFDELIPPALFPEHPEYFPLIKGRRTDGYVQRCLTNPEVLRLAIRTVRGWIRAHPEATLYSVSQNDTDNWCECEACRAMTEKYGAHSGLYLWFVNQVAAAIEPEHPRKLIDTLAYQFTEAAPKDIVPRRNVRVRLCATACCQAHSYGRCSFPANAAFVKKLRAWDAITDSLYIWHYSHNYNYLMPLPNFAEFPDDVRLYERSGVKGIFFQGAAEPGGGGSEAELRSWVMAKLLWDPSADTDALVTEWMRGVYAKAWPPMRRWFDLLHAKVRAPEAHFGISDAPGTVPYLTAEVVAEGDRLFDQAERLFAGDPVAADYVTKSRLWLRYVKLMQHPTNGPELRSFVDELRRRGIRRLQGDLELEAWEQGYRSRSLKGMGP